MLDSEFFTAPRWTPQYQDQHFGVLPLVLGTLQITMISGPDRPADRSVGRSTSASMPAPRTRFDPEAGARTAGRHSDGGVRLLALRFSRRTSSSPVFQDWLGLHVDGFNALSGGIVVGIMIMPMVCSLSEDVLRAVPQSLREAGYALGSTKFDVSAKIVVPSALSGIFASFLLALRAASGKRWPFPSRPASSRS